MPDGAGARHYAVRRVNPFEGVLQVVETHNARAYSPNGRVWQLQVLAQRPDHTWRSFNQVAPIEQFFNFGLWDAGNGLHRVPANPMLDIGAMSSAADELTTALAALQSSLPFTLVDDFECWATDYKGRPVALLATTENPAMVREIRASRWQATRIADHRFVSPALLAREIPCSGDLGPRQHAEQLERQVRQLGQHRAWFRRLADGSGERLGGGAQPEAGTLAAEDFPPLGLKTDWQDEQARALAADYLAWLAPLLLTLQRLDDGLRAQLEHEACRQAAELAAIFVLIPRVIDRAAVDAARVEARLRRSTG